MTDMEWIFVAGFGAGFIFNWLGERIDNVARARERRNDEGR